MIRKFGTTHDGRDVQAITLCGHGLSATVLTYGAILQSVRLDGLDYSLTLGRDSMADYEAGYHYFGPVIGPVANRISNAAARVGGVEYCFTPNENGKTLLHSGAAGIHAKHWAITEHSETACAFALDVKDGADGFPGNRQITARYSLEPTQTLRLELSATSDADTLINMTQHGYWNLDGSNSAAGHSLRIAADTYLSVNADQIPETGPRPVEGTPFDFRAARPFAPGVPDLDHNFCLSQGAEPLREVLWLDGKTGVRMALATTEPGVQVYDHRDRAPFYHALAIEPQGWPDAPNRPDFPSIALAAGGRKTQISEWRFS